MPADHSLTSIWNRAYARAASALPTRVDRRLRAILRDDVPTFMELPHARRPADLAGLDAVFLGYPFEGVKIDSPLTYLPETAAPAGPDSIYYRTGAAEAPASIRRYSIFYSIDHGYGFFPEIAPDFAIFNHLKAADYGDVEVVPADPAESFRRCAACVGEVLDAGAVPLVLGGDHATPAPALAALSPRTAGNIGVIAFDSHYDLSLDPPYYAGSQWAQSLHLPNLQPANLVLVGMRGLRHCLYEQYVAEELGLPVFTMGQVDERGLAAVVADALDRACDGTEALYVSLDIDVMDPASVPAQKYPEPAGLTTRQMIAALRQIGARRKLAGFDLCCLGPQYDLRTGISSQTCARFFVEVLATLALHNSENA
jgi:agmatinase